MVRHRFDYTFRLRVIEARPHACARERLRAAGGKDARESETVDGSGYMLVALHTEQRRRCQFFHFNTEENGLTYFFLTLGSTFFLGGTFIPKTGVYTALRGRG